MPAQYLNISAAEMDQFLTHKGFAKIELEGTFEAVYGKRVHQDDLQLTLRVYTGIQGQVSRGVGEDAIRVNLFMRTGDKIIKLGGSKRVHRVVNWKANLSKRIDDWLDYMPKHKCQKCGLPMIVRTSKHGKFLGCAGYPNCKEVKSV